MSVATPIRIGLNGATGRMGTRIIQLLREDGAATLGAAIERPDHDKLGTDVGLIVGTGPLGAPLTASLDVPVDVLIDFSTPSASLRAARLCADRGVALVIGTTGFEPTERAELDSLADRVPVLIASNFSKAVNLLFKLVGDAASALGAEADIEIIERHHHFKQDAPSGTALTLARMVSEGTGSTTLVHGRAGQVGPRRRGEIGMHALRTGDNPGEHTVVFGLMGECLELTHRALNRDGFARGAIEAARFLVGKPPGRYAMADLLGA